MDVVGGGGSSIRPLNSDVHTRYEALLAQGSGALWVKLCTETYTSVNENTKSTSSILWIERLSELLEGVKELEREATWRSDLLCKRFHSVLAAWFRASDWQRKNTSKCSVADEVVKLLCFGSFTDIQYLNIICFVFDREHFGRKRTTSKFHVTKNPPGRCIYTAPLLPDQIVHSFCCSARRLAVTSVVLQAAAAARAGRRSLFSRL